MSITAQTTKVQYQGSSSPAEEYPVTFKFLAASDLAVVLTDADDVDTTLTLDTQYTVFGTGDDSGGTVTITDEDSRPGEGEYLTIYLDMTIKQEIDLQNSSTFYADTLEEGYDRLTLLLQQLSEELGRCLKYTVSTTAEDMDTDVTALTEAADKAEAALVAAEAAAAKAQAAAQKMDFPDIAEGDADAFLTVKSDESGTEYVAGADARDKLGLGTAALADTGTEAGEIPVLDGDALVSIDNLPLMAGCTASNAGAEGLVPAPAAGDEEKVLLGSGQWTAFVSSIAPETTDYTEAGSYAYTVPDGVTLIFAEALGGGGGGGGAAQVYSSASSGKAGGTSSVGGTITASGGSGGSYGHQSGGGNGGSGGSGGLGMSNTRGASGSAGDISSSGGGGTFSNGFGIGSAGASVGVNTVGKAAAGNGNGGSGGHYTLGYYGGGGGGAGGYSAGFVAVSPGEEIIVVVGAAGSSGSGTYPGGVGSPGRVRIWTIA